jgi:hypothetical protein
MGCEAGSVANRFAIRASGQDCHSGLMLAARITVPHFSGWRQLGHEAVAFKSKIFCSISLSMGFCRIGISLNRLSTLSAS